jgi:hypothetical protein
MEHPKSVFEDLVKPQRDPHVSGFCGRHADQFSVHQFELAGFIGQPLELLKRHQSRDRAHGIHHFTPVFVRQAKTLSILRTIDPSKGTEEIPGAYHTTRTRLMNP